MTQVASSAARRRRRRGGRRIGRWVLAGLAVVLLVAMGFGTTVVSPEEASRAAQQGVDPATFAEENYESVAAGITERAVALPEVATAIEQDQQAAAKKYAVGDGPTATYSVRFSGTAGRVDSETGQLPIKVDGVPGGLEVAVQTGPALLGTALRDATGEVTFPMFTNQLGYQSAGDELNQQMKRRVLADLDPASLAGTEVTVVGAFQSVNPEVLLVMPVKIEET